MSIFSYHLLKLPLIKGLKNTLWPLKPRSMQGLIHGEGMTVMTLGSPILSTDRILVRQQAFFAQWEHESALDHFLAHHQFGKQLARGWHCRLAFLRQWGSFHGFKIPDQTGEPKITNGPVVAVTIARMKFLQIPRFINWGRPVEKLVRDHPAISLALASIKLPNTVSTFSIWHSSKDMTDMVMGHSTVPQPHRHIDAMKERDKKDFHYEFTTLRFAPIAEYGEWNGRSNIISSSDNAN
jgi:hypothetical protein